MKKLISHYDPFHDRTRWYYVNDNNKPVRISFLVAARKLLKSISEKVIDELTTEYILSY